MPLRSFLRPRIRLVIAVIPTAGQPPNHDYGVRGRVADRRTVRRLSA